MQKRTFIFSCCVDFIKRTWCAPGSVGISFHDKYIVISCARTVCCVEQGISVGRHGRLSFPSVRSIDFRTQIDQFRPLIIRWIWSCFLICCRIQITIHISLSLHLSFFTGTNHHFLVIDRHGCCSVALESSVVERFRERFSCIERQTFVCADRVGVDLLNIGNNISEVFQILFAGIKHQ
ncbi:hypothetical protein D3C80_1353560 [compost metagenome]